MKERKHTIGDLKQMQSLPLESKIRMTMARIEGWIDEFGIDGVYISFSGGKDSTVLMDIIRNEMGYKEIPAVFVNVPTQFPELKEFAQKWDNVTILSPKISFMQVCEKYGFPLISKNVSQAIKDVKTQARINGIDPRETILYKRSFIPDSDYVKKYPAYSNVKWDFFFDAKFNVSDECCKVMKKAPAKEYEKKTGRKPILATMATESNLRQTEWLLNGCNSFNGKRPSSKPMSFWTEQDVLKYIVERNIPICSVYGEVVEDFESEGIFENQVTFDCFKEDRIYKTTGMKRTGCALCGFGCQMRDDDRFLLLHESHPKMYNLLDVIENNGVTFREAIEWTNEHLENQHIKL